MFSFHVKTLLILGLVLLITFKCCKSMIFHSEKMKLKKVFFMCPKHMFWLKNKKNSIIQLHSLIWRCADVSFQIQYCSESCREAAWQLYHQCLCLGSAREDPEHPVNRLLELWRSVNTGLDKQKLSA